jgi:mRNA interferase RelE/StbE
MTVARVVFTDAALDDLRRIGPDTVPRVLKKMLLLERDPRAGMPLGDELTGFRKLVVGRNTWRIVYRIQTDGGRSTVVEVCEIWAVGARRDSEVFAEAVERVRAAVDTRPEIVPLLDVVARLGRLAGDIGRDMDVPAPPARDPVPAWLAERLIYTVGLPRAEVAALDLEKAVDLWTEYVSRPR